MESLVTDFSKFFHSLALVLVAVRAVAEETSLCGAFLFERWLPDLHRLADETGVGRVIEEVHSRCDLCNSQA